MNKETKTKINTFGFEDSKNLKGYYSPSFADIRVAINQEQVDSVVEVCIADFSNDVQINSLTFIISLPDDNEEECNKELSRARGELLGEEAFLSVDFTNSKGKVLSFYSSKIKFTGFDIRFSAENRLTEYVYDFEFLGEERMGRCF